MKNPIQISTYLTRPLARFGLTFALCVVLPALLCLIPVRGVIAIPFITILIIVISHVSSLSASSSAGGLQAREDDPYEQAKQQWRREIEHGIKMKGMLDTHNHCRVPSQGIEPPGRPRQLSQAIMRVTVISSSNSETHRQTQMRQRNEMNDRELEKRIEAIFCRIRTVDLEGYEEGIEEICTLLLLRQKCLQKNGLSPLSSRTP